MAALLDNLDRYPDQTGGNLAHGSRRHVNARVVAAVKGFVHFPNLKDTNFVVWSEIPPPAYFDKSFRQTAGN